MNDTSPCLLKVNVISNQHTRKDRQSRQSIKYAKLAGLTLTPGIQTCLCVNFCLLGTLECKTHQNREKTTSPVGTQIGKEF
eukprot:749029-Hanusia_phi.AAC.4